MRADGQTDGHVKLIVAFSAVSSAPKKLSKTNIETWGWKSHISLSFQEILLLKKAKVKLSVYNTG